MYLREKSKEKYQPCYHVIPKVLVHCERKNTHAHAHTHTHTYIHITRLQSEDFKYVHKNAANSPAHVHIFSVHFIHHIQS
jgi:hypothetical protein